MSAATAASSASAAPTAIRRQGTCVAGRRARRLATGTECDGLDALVLAGAEAPSVAALSGAGGAVALPTPPATTSSTRRPLSSRSLSRPPPTSSTSPGAQPHGARDRRAVVQHARGLARGLHEQLPVVQADPGEHAGGAGQRSRRHRRRRATAGSRRRRAAARRAARAAMSVGAQIGSSQRITSVGASRPGTSVNLAAHVADSPRARRPPCSGPAAARRPCARRCRAGRCDRSSPRSGCRK